MTTTSQTGAGRATAIAAIVYVLASLVSQSLLQIGGLEPAFDASSADILAFFEARDPVLFEIGGYLHLIALTTFVWFLGSFWTLLHQAEGPAGWRSTVTGASGLAFIASASSGWQLAMFRLDDLSPEMARLSFDLGNLGFANSWIPLASMLVASALAIRSSGALPRWLGTSAGVIGIGLLVARAVWTSQVAFAPWVAFWVWLIVLSVVLLRRPATAGGVPERAANDRA